MQISRHWRKNAQRYRLEGVRYENGEAHLQPRIIPATRRQPAESVNPVQVVTMTPVYYSGRGCCISQNYAKYTQTS